MLASPDPELRDEIAYSTLAHWIYRPNVLSTPTLLSLTDEWRANLHTGLGEVGTNSVLLRSFSALCLSEMGKREAKSPFMGADRYHALLAEATNYLTAERDLRGYDPQLHWIHSTAHTADLLAALADSALLTKEEAATILHAIDARLATAPQVYTQGEQDRLAAAVVSVIRRRDFDASTIDSSALDSWLAHLESEDRRLDLHHSRIPRALPESQLPSASADRANPVGARFPANDEIQAGRAQAAVRAFGLGAAARFEIFVLRNARRVAPDPEGEMG